VIDPDARREAWARLDALLARAEPGSVVVSGEAAPFLERRFEMERLDASEAGEGRACRLIGHASPVLAPRPATSAFVGREEPLQALCTRLAAAMGGQGQVVGIVGDAGIGKSRLIAELCRDLPGEHLMRLEGACLSYATAIPYVPVLAIVRQVCGISESDPAETIAAELDRALARTGLDAAEGAPYLRQLLGLHDGVEALVDLTPEAVRARTQATLRRLITGLARRQPLLVIVEDLHWADAASQEVVAALAEDAAGAALMLVATYRTGFRPSGMERAPAAQIALSPLSAEESRAIARAVLPADVSEDVARTVLDKAEGNPFFIEELARAFHGAGGASAMSTVPDTIEEVLVARIEALSAPLRELLQGSAVLGRRFGLPLLRAVFGDTEALTSRLDSLTALEFLVAVPEGRETVYGFKHALTQEVAYGSLAPDGRRALHAAAGHALEQLFADRLDEAYDRLAYHYARTEEAAKAVEYLERFAQKASRAGAHETAVQAWMDALQHVERLPPDLRNRRRLQILVSLPASLFPLGRVGEAAALLLQERERLEQLRDPALAARYYFSLARIYMVRSHTLVMENASRAIAEAERCGDDAISGAAHGVQAIACALSGQPRRGIECGRRAVALLEKTKDLWSLSYSCWALGLSCSQVGAFPEALVAQQRALDIGRAIGSLPLEASALWATGIVRAAMGDWERGIAQCREAVDKSADVMYRAINSGFLGFAYIEAGDGPAAIAALEGAIPLLQQFGLN
jgi:tetratricopeptide (TPR) repeat protein